MHITQKNKNNNLTNLTDKQRQKISSLFPKQPYETQTLIANKLYEMLNQKTTNVVIVESPTGTGKTYALLAGVLAWLQDNPYEIDKLQTTKQKQAEKQQSNSIPSWLANKTSENKLTKLVQMKQEKVNKIKTIKQVKQTNKKNYKKNQNVKNNDNFEWQVQDLQDIGDQNLVTKRNINTQVQNIFIERDALPKVIFVSRTHSQLSQVMDSIHNIGSQYRYVSMASKDHLCVNNAIQKNKVHQKCQYLMSHGGCPYYHQEAISEMIGLRIQQAKKMGQQNGLCSYFGIKNLLPIADIICVPYSSILNAQIRSRLNINVQNSIIIFDEAHNVIQQQLNIKSPQVGYGEFSKLCSRIDEYRSKYGQRMAQNNLQLLIHIQDICRAFMSVIKQQFDKLNKKHDNSYQYQTQYQENIQQRKEQLTNYVKMTKIQLFSRLKLQQIKVYNIKNYIALSNFDQKLVHFDEKQQFSLSIINNFLDFISILTSNTSTRQKQIESSVVLIKNLINNESSKTLNLTSMKIFCMQSTQIADIVNRSRMTIMAGGTMQPVSSFTNIFKQNNLSYKFIKGEHVIKDQQCNVFCIGGIRTQKQNKLTEKQNVKLTFTFKQLKNIAKIMQKTCKIIRKILKNTEKNSGTIIFLQNYGLLQVIANNLGTQFQNKKIFYDGNSQKQGKKPINKNYQKNVFEKFQKVIKQQKKSAILVSVMGGRLSQGINFSDQLARSIIVLGLPYPNLKSPEMIEKMSYLDKKIRKRLQQKKQKGEPVFQSANNRLKKQKSLSQSQIEETGNGYYQNCCIQTINQTIGRGIRHINDYANIYLIDFRFSGIAHRLPSWMQRRVKHIDFYQC